MLRYWLWLTTRKGLGARGQLALLTHFGAPDAAYMADEAAYRQVAGLPRRDLSSLMDKSLDLPERILNECYEKEIKLLTLQDAQYPERLRNIDDPPVLLYYRGRLPSFDTEAVVAMVGSRKASAYGLVNAKRIGFQLGKCGAVVASGMAAGVDTMALTGALTAGRPVVGVLGCGADVVYPPSNASLYRDVEQHGCLLTEYPPGTRPYGQNFPVRNRILSGLSVGVVVVEAGEKSGALITAQRAIEQGRDVFAVPANIGVASSMGSNRLLKEGALFAESGWDVAREYIHLYPDKLHEYTGGGTVSLSPDERRTHGEAELPRVASEVRTPAASDKKAVDNGKTRVYIDLRDKMDALSQDERAIVALLAEHESSVDDLIDQAQIPASRILAALTLLEVKRYIVRLAGRRYRLAYEQEAASAN